MKLAVVELGHVHYKGGKTHFSRGVHISSSEIAANAMRKLIPLSKRIRLEEMSPEAAITLDLPIEQGDTERLTTDADGKTISTMKIAKIFKEVDIKICTLTNGNEQDEDNRQICGKPIKNLHDFLLFDRLLEPFDGKTTRWAYKGTDILRMPVRHICDMGHLMKQLVKAIDERKKKKKQSNTRLDKMNLNRDIIDTLSNLLTQFINEDHLLSSRSRKLILRGTKKDYMSDEWELRIQDINFRSPMGPCRSFYPKHNNANTPTYSLHAHNIRSIVVQNRDQVSQYDGTFASYTIALLIMLYDFLQLSSQGLARPHNLPDKSIKDRAYTKWHDSNCDEHFKIPWFTNVYHSYWKFSVFTGVWNTGLEKINYIQKYTTDESDQTLSLYLLYLWLAAGSCTLSYKNNDTLLQTIGPRYKSKNEDKNTEEEEDLWTDKFLTIEMNTEKLKESINDLSDEIIQLHEANQFNSRYVELYNWFINIACILCPETGLQTSDDTLFSNLLDFKTGPLLLKKFTYRVKKERLNRMGKYILTPTGYSLLTGEALHVSYEKNQGGLSVDIHTDDEAKTKLKSWRDPFIIDKVVENQFRISPDEVKIHIRKHFLPSKKSHASQWHKLAKLVYENT